MGILEPMNKEAHFMKKISTDANCLMDSAIQKLDLFSEDLTDEALQEYAIEFLNAGLFDQAAEAFRNLGDEHNYHFCKGQLELEQQNYDSAIHHLYTSAVVETGEHDIQSGDLISEYAKIALNKSTGEERSSTLAKILLLRMTFLMKHDIDLRLNEMRREVIGSKQHRITSKLKTMTEQNFVLNTSRRRNVRQRCILNVGSKMRRERPSSPTLIQKSQKSKQ